jgi:molybdopterin converting factor small subunit
MHCDSSIRPSSFLVRTRYQPGNQDQAVVLEGVNVRIHVEFLGVARLVTGVRETTLDIAADATFRDIVRVLGIQYPALIGSVIQPDGGTLYPSHVLNHNAKQMIQPHQMAKSPNDGDRIAVMSILAGG